MAEPDLPSPVPPPSPPRPAGPTAGWQTAGETKPGRGKMLAIASLLFCTVAGVTIAVLLMPTKPASPYFVSLPISEYDQSQPPAWALEDSKRLMDCFPDDATENASGLTEKVKIIEKLNAIKKGEITRRGDNSVQKLERDRVFLFHIIGHVAVAQGVVYLLPNKASNEPSSWVKLDDILGAMADCPAQRKCLILDLSRPRTNPLLGPLLDDATPVLHDYLKAKQDKGELACPVLLSCQQDQFSQVIPDEKASAFAYYLAEGLKGEADGYDDKSTGTRDNKVKLNELAHFLKIRVGRWAKQNRFVAQQPILYTVGNQDFDLTIGVKPAIPIPPEDPEKPEQVKPRDISPLSTIDWTERLKLAADPRSGRRVAPLLFRWDSAALRAERVFESTNKIKPEEIPAKLLSEANTSLTSGVESPKYRSLLTVPFPASPPTVPNMPPPPNPTVALRSAFKLYLDIATADGKVDEIKVRDLKMKFDETTSAAGINPDVVARAIWEVMTDEYPAELKRKVIAEVQAAMKARRGNDLFTESIVLEQAYGLHERFDSTDHIEMRRAVRNLIAVENAMAKAISHGATGFEWVQHKLTEADTAKRTAEQNLLAAKSSTEAKKAGDELQSVIPLFADITNHLTTLAYARATADEAIRFLVGSAYARAEYDYPAEKPWQQLAKETRLLADQVYRTAYPGWNPAELKSLADRVEKQRVELMALFLAPVIEKLVKVPESKEAKELAQYQAILSTPFPTVAERKALWEAMNKVTVRLHQTTRKDYDIIDNTNRKPSPEVKPPDSVIPRDQAARRARVAISLLQLADNPDAAKCETELNAITGSDLKGWATLATSLRVAWEETRGKLAKKAEAEGKWPQLDRLGRVFPTGLPVERKDSYSGEVWAVAPIKWRRAEESLYYRWLADHYRAYGMLRKAVPSAANWYEQSAQKASDESNRDAQ